MIYAHKNASKYLYHYTKADTAINKILKHKQLKFGSYQCTNDPKETKQWIFDIGTNEDRDISDYDLGKLSCDLSFYLKGNTKLLCFSMDRDELSGDHTKDIYKRGFCKPRMWAQYANNHSGMCLVFDFKSLSEKINNEIAHKFIVEADKVSYINRFLVDRLQDSTYKINVDYLEKHGMDGYALAHFKKFHKRLFFEKLMDWSYEDEYRWIVANSSLDPFFLDVSSSLIGIVFGDMTSEDDIDKAIELTGYSLEYAGLKWRNCAPWYDFANDKYIRNSPWRRRMEGEMASKKSNVLINNWLRLKNKLF